MDSSQLVTTLANTDRFANMPMEDLQRYVTCARVIDLTDYDDDGDFPDPYQGIVPRQIFHSEDYDSGGASYIDINDNVYIETKIIPDIKGQWIAHVRDAGDSVFYIISTCDNKTYIQYEWGLEQFDQTLSKVVHVFALTSTGDVLIYETSYVNIDNEDKRELPPIVDLEVADFENINDLFSFLLYLRDVEGNNWIAFVGDYFLQKSQKIYPPQPIKSVSFVMSNKIGHWDHEKMFFVLYQDGTAGTMTAKVTLGVVLEKMGEVSFNTLASEETFVEMIEGALYDKNGNEYVLEDGALVKTKYTKWNSHCGEHMIRY